MITIKGFPLEDQVVLITGGSQGLGREFAQVYYKSSERTKIIITSRSESKLRLAAQLITYSEEEPQILTLKTKVDYKRRVYYIPEDLSRPEGAKDLLEILLKKQFVPTQILSCAGGSIPKLFRDLSPNELALGIQMNYMTALYLCHRVAQLQLKCHIVLFSSSTAFFPFIGYSQYAPAKVSLKALASILRQEMGKHTRISCIYPGNFESEGFATENLTKPDITKRIEGASPSISCEETCNKIIWWLQRGYDDITTDTIGWVLMSLDMGLNKSYNKSFLWYLQLILGSLANLILVPIYMAICQYQVRHWIRAQHLEDTQHAERLI